MRTRLLIGLLAAASCAEPPAGNAIEPGPETWTSDGRTVTFQGALCQRLKDALPSSPGLLEFRVPLP